MAEPVDDEPIEGEKPETSDEGPTDETVASDRDVVLAPEKSVAARGARKRRAADRPKRRRRTQVAPQTPNREPRIRVGLVFAAVCAAAGVLLVGTGPSVIGAVLAVGGVLGLVAGIHFFGRLGADGAEES